VQGIHALATGGGSGHLPVFLGYVGQGMLDGCAVGDVFASPSADQMLEVTKRISGGKGVVYIYGNYGGDVMNFDMATEMASFEDIEVRTVLVKDDVASAPPEEAAKRRGVAQQRLRRQCAGARAAEGAPLAEVAAVARKAAAGCRSIGVALTPCVVPESGKASFAIADDEIEFGMGIHGEPGIWRGKLKGADELAQEMLDRLLPELDLRRGSRVAVGS